MSYICNKLDWGQNECDVVGSRESTGSSLDDIWGNLKFKVGINCLAYFYKIFNLYSRLKHELINLCNFREWDLFGNHTNWIHTSRNSLKLFFSLLKRYHTFWFYSRYVIYQVFRRNALCDRLVCLSVSLSVRPSVFTIITQEQLDVEWWNLAQF